MDGERLAKVLHHYVAVMASMIDSGTFDRGYVGDWPILVQKLTEPGMVKYDRDVDGVTIGGYTFVVNQDDKSIAIHDAQLGDGEPLFTVAKDGQITKNYQNKEDLGYSVDPVVDVLRDVGSLYTPATVSLALTWKS